VHHLRVDGCKLWPVGANALEFGFLLIP
jgi:hypothetical protein